MRGSLKRRDFLVTAALSAGCFVAGRASAQRSRSANGQLNFACVGVGGRGAQNTDDAARAGKIVALCDIDETMLKPKTDQFPDAKRYFSFNQMLDDQANEIDAVVISTPDHVHAAASLKAMRAGKHVYCEKPLCRSVGEARRLSEVAYKAGVVTQMGNQGSADAGFRRTLEAVRSGVIGTIHEIHAWMGNFHLPTGPNARPNLTGNPPPHIHWDEFIGPCEFQPYSDDFQKNRWGGWWAFGTGQIGTGCHILNLAFHACDLRNPTTIEAQHSGHNRIAFPASSRVRWDFAATRKRPPVTLHWYDGGNQPDAKLLHGEPMPQNGCLLVGERGKLLTSNELFNTSWMLLPERQKLNPGSAYDYYLPAASSHFREFADAIHAGGATMSSFADVAGPMNETLLLGNLAIWAEKKIEWDSTALSVKNHSDLASIVTPTYRSGYTF